MSSKPSSESSRGVKTVLLVPTEGEAVPLRAARPFADVRICGVGMAAAAAYTAALLLRERPDRILLCGIAGAYDHALPHGTVVAVCTEQVAGLPGKYTDRYAAAPLPDWLPTVVSNTVSRPCEHPDGARIENMEGAAVLAVCRAVGVPCSEIRAVSNYVGDPFGQWHIPQALENLAAAVGRLLDKNGFTP